MENHEKRPLPEARTYTVEDVAAILNIGRTSAYTLVKEGHFKTVRIGTAIRISKNRLTSGWRSWSCKANR